MKICLDPGHYGSDYNPGVAAGYVESNFTWRYYLLMKERLERYGVEVVCTRASKDDYPKNPKGDDWLKERGRRSKGCDLFISIHSNAAVDEKTQQIKPEINSVFIHWSVRSGGEEIGKKIGNALTMFFRSEWGSCQAPTMYERESSTYPGYDWFGVLKGAAEVGVPGIIVEHSFHTNPIYCEWAMQPGNCEKMADIEVSAIAEYYGLSPITNDPYFIPLNVDLKKGDKGNDVKRMQMRFRQINEEYNDEVRQHSFTQDGLPDGSFGGKMEKTVRNFQHDIGLPETGVLDAATRTILNTTVIEYANRVTELIQQNRDLKQEYEDKLSALKDKAQNLEDRISMAKKYLG